MRALPLGVALALLLPATATAQQVTVYSSLPLQGAQAPTSRDVVRGMQLALERAGGQAGAATVRYVSLDDSTAEAGNWTPEMASMNARRAAADRSAVAYLGEFNSGATAISLPILNEAGILQISPSNTATGLTERGPGSDRGEPEKFYPTGRRTYGRVAPNDAVQARAGGALLRALGVRRVLVVHDGEVYGRGLAVGAARAARARGVRVVGTVRLRTRGRNARAIARLARRRRAQAVFYGGITVNGAVRLRRSLHAHARRVQLVGGDGVAEPAFTRRIGSAAARRSRVLVGAMAPEAYPESGREVLTALGPGTGPYALYGYEAMSLALDAIARGGATRDGTVRAFFATRDRDSVLGRYSIEPDGDVTTTAYGVYRVSRGDLAWERVVGASS